MANPQKTSLIINPSAYGAILKVESNKKLEPGDKFFQNGYEIGTVLGNSGLVGSLWGVDIIVSNVIPKTKRSYTKIIGRYFLHKAVRYKVTGRMKIINIKNKSNYRDMYEYREPDGPPRAMSYYKIKKLL